MTTPWGGIEVADSHVHFFSHGFLSLLARQRNCSIGELEAALGWEMPAADPAVFAARWVAELDRHGVSRAAIIASLPGDEDSVAAAVRAFPDRFDGFFLANPMEPGAAANVEARLGQGLRGVCLFPAMHRYSMHEERVDAIAGIVAAQPGAVLFVHCGVLTVGVRRKLGLASPFDLRYSNPVDVHALAMRRPDLPIVIPHFGAGYLREALMLCDLCPNVYLDTSSTNSWMKYQESDCTLTSVFQRALGVAGPRRLLFGTDSSFFPRGWNRAILDGQIAALQETGIGADDARAILGGNLSRLLGRD